MLSFGCKPVVATLHSVVAEILFIFLFIETRKRESVLQTDKAFLQHQEFDKRCCMRNTGLNKQTKKRFKTHTGLQGFLKQASKVQHREK